jgi:hypothetical protein
MDALQYYSQYRLLVCRTCQLAIQPGHVREHLGSEGHRVLQEMVNEFREYHLADSCTERNTPKATVTSQLDQQPAS